MSELTFTSDLCVPENKNKIDRLDHSLRSVERLVAVVQELSMTRSLDAIMAIVKVAARELTGADGSTFVLRDGDQCFYAEEDAIAPLWKGQRFPMHICLGGWTMRHREAAVIDDIYGDERIPFQAYEPTFVKSLAMVPIRQLDPIGAIGTYWAELHQPTREELALLQALADTTAVAMENVQIYNELEQRVRDRTIELQTVNAKLIAEINERQKAEAEVRQLSLTDELTGLRNRRGFFLLAEQELKLARRNQIPCYFLFIDLDGLKQINDTFGHEMGDRVLISAAHVIKQTFRDSDIVARLGGDEFVVFAPGYLGHPDDIRSRLQSNVEVFNVKQACLYQLAMSVGIEQCDPDRNISLEEMVARADELMYYLKRHKKQSK